MAKFCETCPDRRDCTTDIVGVDILSSISEGTISQDGSTAMLEIERGTPVGPTQITAKYLDGQGGHSEPVTVSASSGYEAARKVVECVDLIGECTQPIKTKKLFGLVTKTTCSVNKY